jgi:hypothetical protein
MPYAILNPEGSIREIVCKLNPSIQLQPGERIASYDPPEVVEDEFTILAVEPVPEDAQSVSFAVTQRPDAIDNAKAKKNAQINASRLIANRGTFEFQGKQIAVDALSRSDIDGVHGFISATKSLPPGWPGGWKAEDNTFVSISTHEAWITFYSAMVASGTANFARSQGLKARVYACTTLEQVKALPDW